MRGRSRPGIVALRALAVAGLALGLPLRSAAQPPGDFEHLTTRFPLTGAHARVPCEDCHRGGVFSGTPIQCGQCHTRGGPRQAEAKPLQHVPSSDQCDDCHVTNSWSPARFDHAGVTSPCITCHNGGFASGKQPGHVQSPDDCEACHGTLAWSPAFFDHSMITTSCFSCHNGTTATGKHPGHVPSSNDCETCHNTRSWETAGFDHTGITDNCVSCHDGHTATGKNAGHIPSSDACETCHDTRTWAGARFDHAGVSGNCASCHDGRIATGLSPGHFVVTGIDCVECHQTSAWLPSTFRHTSPNYPGDHAGNLECRACHANNSPTVAWPFPPYAPDCAACHADDFRPGSHLKIESPQTQYTVGELRDCSGACHTYRDATLTTITRSRTGEHSVRSRGW